MEEEGEEEGEGEEERGGRRGGKGGGKKGEKKAKLGRGGECKQKEKRIGVKHSQADRCIEFERERKQQHIGIKQRMTKEERREGRREKEVRKDKEGKGWGKRGGGGKGAEVEKRENER
ncbi:hypothetical protein, partial [Devosia epidermidihirudinis]|uniref:hypothetical protein n=1 Tax=Devosia epidermidihirudinis TaxID=1293439 RepID=UPI0012E35A56